MISSLQSTSALIKLTSKTFLEKSEMMAWDLLELRSVSRHFSGKRHLANTHKASEGTPGNFDLLKLKNKTAQGSLSLALGLLSGQLLLLT